MKKIPEIHNKKILEISLARLARSQDARSTNKNQTFLCNSKCNWKQFSKSVSFTTVPQNEHLGINLTKDVNALQTDNHKMFMIEIKEMVKGRDALCSWIGRLMLFQ